MELTPVCTRPESSNFCENSTEGGFDDWELPTIDELRMLITEECPETQYGSGVCQVSDPSCLDSSTCYSEATCECATDTTGKYSKLGDTDGLWSSSKSEQIFFEEETAWELIFSRARTLLTLRSAQTHVRCVRDAN